MRNLLLKFTKPVLVTGCVLTTVMALNASAQMGAGDWIPQKLTFHVQWPYNTRESERYIFTNGVYHLWVYNDDVPFKLHNKTKPRTEQRFEPDYSHGEIQYQSMMLVTTNTSGTCIFQIHTGNAETHHHGSTTFMLFWFKSDGGSLRDYSHQELARNLSGKWFQLNCDHNLATHTITVWINKKRVWRQRDNGAGDFYFKDGVYAQSGASRLMGNHIRDIHIWTRADKIISPSARSSGVNNPGADNNTLSYSRFSRG